MLEKVISGGQTGADRAALEAAVTVGIPTGGWAPPGFMTSRGQDLVLRDQFHLEELVSSPQPLSIAAAYVRRSMANVDDADGTVAFRLHASAGTDKTIAYAQSGRWGGRSSPSSSSSYRPCRVITSLDDALTSSHLSAFRQ